MKKIKKTLKEWRFVIMFGSLILILALVIRFYNLTYLPIFVDEAIYIRWSQIIKTESTLRFLPLSDGKQPLFMWLTVVFFKITTNPLFAGRTVSVLAGIGSLFGIFLTTLAIFKSKKMAIISSLIYTLCPYTMFFDRIALVDSLLAMFGIWVFLFSYLTSKHIKLDLAMITGFLLGAALLTKSSAVFFSLLIPTTWLLSDWPKKFKDKLLHLIKLGLHFIPTYLIAYGIYNILRLGPNFNMIGQRNADYIFPLSHLWINPKDPFIFFIDRSFQWIEMMGPWPILALALIGIIFLFKKFRKEILVLSAWFIVPILIHSEFMKVYTARYVVFTIPYLIVLASLWIENKKELVKKLSLVIFLVFMVLAAKFDHNLLNNIEAANLPRSERSGYLEEWTAGTGIWEISKDIREIYNQNPEEKIVVGTEGYFGTLPDGLQVYLNDLPEITIIGVGLPIDEVPSQLIDSKIFGNRTLLVVNSSRLKIVDYEKIGLELKAAYSKAFRPEGIKEYNQYGPRDTLYLFEITPEAIYLSNSSL